MRLINHKDFEPGPFNLGKFGPIVGIIACLWITFITVSPKVSFALLKMSTLQGITPVCCILVDSLEDQWLCPRHVTPQ